MYTTNQTVITNFTDKYGNKTPREIRIDQIDDKGPNVKVKYAFSADRKICTVTVTSDEEMKLKTLAGWVLRS